MGDLFFDLTCATCSVEDSESCTRQNLSWLVFLNNPLSATVVFDFESNQWDERGKG